LVIVWTLGSIHIIQHAMEKMDTSLNTNQHYGIIGVFGKPNAGKSTFLNAVIGQKLAAVSRKAHTTRHQISGIFIEGDYQILFLDTPGSIEFEKRNKLQQSMANEIKEKNRKRNRSTSKRKQRRL